MSAWLRVIGRLRPGASVEGVAPRLTGLLRNWLEHDSGYPSNWMPDVIQMLPKQVINIVPAGAGVGEMKEEYGRSLQILLAVCGLVLPIVCANVANLLLARAAARRQEKWRCGSLSAPAAASGHSIQALTECLVLALAGGIVGLIVATAAARLLLVAGVSVARTSVPISTRPSLAVLGFAFGLARRDRRPLRRGAGMVRDAHRPGGQRFAGPGRSTQRSLVAGPQCAARCPGHAVGRVVAGSTMLARSLANLEHQDFGYPVQGRVLIGLNRLPSTYTLPGNSRRSIATSSSGSAGLPGVRGDGLAL